MTKSQAQQYARLSATVLAMGVSREDFEKLLRIEKTLSRWHERECNGEVVVEEDGTAYGHAMDVDGVPFVQRWAIPNREAGALRRLSAIMARYPKLAAYVQGDPRGCALYVYSRSKLNTERQGCSQRECFCHDPHDVREHPCASCGCQPVSIDSCYSSVGVAMAV